jgi:monoamine oxidase
MATNVDTVIIGGGFTGVTAARELTMRGRSSVLLEAHDRLGGRTYTAQVDGHGYEYGGTWVHPVQPNVWAEITRYGLKTEVFPPVTAKQMIVTGGKLRALSDAELVAGLEDLAKFCAPAAQMFPDPASGKIAADPLGLTERTARDYLDSFKFSSQVTRDFVDAFFTLTVFAPLDQGAAFELLRVYALSGSTPELLMASMTQQKLVTGTKGLIDAIASHAKLSEIRLGAVVKRVTARKDGVEVQLTNGETVTGRTALVTLPLNVFNTVEFEPRLSDTKRAGANERQAGVGSKCFVTVKGDPGDISVFAPESEIVNFAVPYYRGKNSSSVVAFVANPSRLKFDDIAGMQEALRRLIPGVVVERIDGTNWTEDPYARGTWCIFRPGQVQRLIPELRRTEGRVFFANADSAVAWRSFIDGAIESGYRSAGDIDSLLTSAR